MILHTGRTKSFRERSLNNALTVEQHPSLVVEKIVARWGSDLIFTYSRYEVAPPGFQALAPRSPVLQVSACDITPDWIADRFAELSPKEELAWHSWVECRGVDCHIPMIDFVGRPRYSTICALGQMLAAEISFAGDLALFNTGRSFHGYFPDLIPEHSWPRYLGHLLLLNQHDRQPLIDTRWVGHALVRGFTALRWSHNTDRYKAMPSLVSILDIS